MSTALICIGVFMIAGAIGAVLLYRTVDEPDRNAGSASICLCGGIAFACVVTGLLAKALGA